MGVVQNRFLVSLVLVAAAEFLPGIPPAAPAALPLPADAAEADPVYEQPLANPLDRDTIFQEVTVLPGGQIVLGESGEVAGSEPRLIYGNTLGINTIDFYRPNLPVSDDIATTAPDGCNLKMFKFKVLGKVLSTTSCSGGSRDGLSCATDANCIGGGTCIVQQGPFTVKYALYSTCPLAVGPTNATAPLRELVKIPGTSGEISFPDDTPRTIKHVVDSHNPVPIPTNFFLGLQFNRGNCGTVIGAPAMVGFSADSFDFPNFPCNGYLGGFPQLPHASFWAEVYADAGCPSSFPGYKVSNPSGGVATLGADVQGVDDVHLQVENCRLIGYEVVVKGVGFYTFDLRRGCDGPIIEGTQKFFSVSSATTPLLQVARFTFDPPIALPNDNIYLGFKCSSISSGVVIAGISPVIGASSSDIYTIGLEGCAPRIPTVGVHGAINLAITCAGKQQNGACCDMALLECQGGPDNGKRCPADAFCVGGADNDHECSPSNPCASPGVCQPFCAAPGTCEAVCRETPEMNCPWPPRDYPQLGPAWVEGGTCADPPFEHTCGQSACCEPDDTCENLTKNECDSVPPSDRPRLWQAGVFCGEGGQSCPFNACLAREGDCGVVHNWGGCSDPFCCPDVCAVDPWCCHVEWDRICLDYVAQLCQRPPVNDACGPEIRPYPGAIELTHGVPYYGNNLRATQSDDDPGYCCNAADPGVKGYGTVWFKFVATQTSAQIDTCASDPEGDTMVDVFSAGDSPDGPALCPSLSLIGCGDNEGCPAPVDGVASLHSRFCVDGLTIGAMYYIMLASKSWSDLGSYEIEVKLPCQYLTPFSRNDCNDNGVLDGCDLAERTGRDCDQDGIPDECNADLETSPDCDGDNVPDTCDPFRQRIIFNSLNPWLNQRFGSAVALADDLLVVGDPDFDGIGAVHTYKQESRDWVYSDHIYNPSFYDYTSYGYALAASGNNLLVLASDTDANDHVWGRVFAYSRVGSTWVEEEFPPLPSDASSSAMDAIIMNGELAAVRTTCYHEPQNCNVGVTVHMFRRVDSHWRPDGIVPAEGSFDGRSFAFDLDDGYLAVTTKGKYPASEDASGFLLVFEKQGEEWVQTTQRSLWVENATSISMSDTLIAVGGKDSESKTGRELAVLSLYRQRRGVWDDGGALATGHEATGVLPQVAILSPISLAITVSSPNKCPAAAIFQRTSYTCDWCGYWFPLTQLTLTHCGSEPRNVSMAAGANGLVLGLWGSIFYPPSPDLPPSSVQVFVLPSTDCNGNGTPDLCEIQTGSLEDCNNDKAADVCQAREYFDYDLDLTVTLRDMAGLQNCFSGTPSTRPCCGMFDESGQPGIDMVDVQQFVAAMTGP